MAASFELQLNDTKITLMKKGGMTYENDMCLRFGV